MSSSQGLPLAAAKASRRCMCSPLKGGFVTSTSKSAMRPSRRRAYQSAFSWSTLEKPRRARCARVPPSQ